MAEPWLIAYSRTHYDRMQRTRELVRAAWSRLVDADRVNATTMEGLCRLTWVTVSQKTPDGIGPEYWRTTKVPALVTIYGLDERRVADLEEAASAIESQEHDARLASLVRAPTGFANFYSAYRNRVLPWLEANEPAVTGILARAASSESDFVAREVLASVEALPPIWKAPGRDAMAPVLALGPLLACLAPNARLPILNGASHVRALMRRLRVANNGLADQCDAFTGLLGITRMAAFKEGPLVNAFELDVCGSHFGAELLAAVEPRPVQQAALASVPTGADQDIPVKDEADVQGVAKGGAIQQRRIHNQMTNALRALAAQAGLRVTESTDPAAKHDALVHNYDGRGRDLLVEVKSSTDRGVVRLAVGQLLDYRRSVERPAATDLLVLLPEAPDADTVEYLHAANVRCSWFSKDSRSAVAGDWSLIVATTTFAR